MHEELEILTKIPVTIPFTDISFNIVITEIIVVSWVVIGLLILWAFLATRKMQAVPKGLQTSAEMVVELINNFAKENIGERWRHFAPYLGALGLYLVLVNTIGALFFVKPPTRDLSIPATLAVMTIILVVGSGIRFKGFGGYLKGLCKPLPIMLPFNILELFIKPLSLCMRLFGNILGAYILMEMVIEGIPAIFPAFASMYFDLFDGALQAFVFVFLTTLYIAEEVGEEE